MSKKKETYSTEKAWKTTETTNPQADVFRSLADGLRRENLLIKKMLDEKEKKLTEQEIYIEQLEKELKYLEHASKHTVIASNKFISKAKEQLDEKDFIRLFGHQYYVDKGK